LIGASRIRLKIRPIQRPSHGDGRLVLDQAKTRLENGYRPGRKTKAIGSN
jgi:hypothetical protein